MKVDGANLAAARERVFMSQEELAEALGMNPYVIIGLETSERTEVRDNLGKDLAEILFVSREELSEMVGQRKNWVRELEQQSRVHVLELFMHRLVEALGVGISDMTTFPDPPPPPTTPEAQKLDVVRLRALREEGDISQ